MIGFGELTPPIFPDNVKVRGGQTRMNEALREWLKEHPMKHA
ncbi:MAG: hypothetical protein PHI31_14415 [Desulfuromonadaceae bacterium]|nr:hypothetical protein [Desulfuromonadaceae bacterium]